jgi:hypothetical protein
MAFNLRNRSFLKEIGFTPRELRYVLRRAGRSSGQVRRQRGETTSGRAR